MSLAGHYWTVAPRLQPSPPEPEAVAWALSVDDPDVGAVRLSGRWSEHQGATEAVLLVHGITGCADSRYARLGAAAAVERGMSCLRLNLRGCDGAGEDYYHAGLTGDLVAAMECPELAGYERVHVLGYSLGGHLALRLAAVDRPPRLGAVAAVCSPLDLAACQQAFDGASLTAPYRIYVLRGLKQIYAAVAARRPVPCPPAVARRIRTIREWDDQVVAPRWGFADAADYYRRESVAPHLAELSVPALLVAAEDDPMVPPETLRPALDDLAGSGGADRLQVRWLHGAGHLGFPGGLRLDLERREREERAAAAAEAGEPAGGEREVGLDAQVVGWLAAAGTGATR